jgi:uncharacterized protein YjbI with pentapeptide repeats
VKSVSAITIQSGANKDSFGIQPHWQFEEFAQDISSMSDDVLADEELQIVDHFFEGGSNFDGDTDDSFDPGPLSTEAVVSGMFVARELPDVCLKGMFMEGADFAGALLHKADFSRANLRMADFSGASLAGASLNQANLTFADLSKADLCETDFRNAELCKADLRGCDLRGSQMAGANLQLANLSGADLRGADLNAANIKGCHLAGACFDAATILPFSQMEAREKGMVIGINVDSSDESNEKSKFKN